jgi:hypothetical protein
MKKATGIGGHHSANMRTDEWLTPPTIVRSLGEFDLDPCSPINRPWATAKKHYSILDNGLSKEWEGRVWMNPPYGKELERWMNKLAFHGNGISLIFARTETATFFNCVWEKANSIFFMKGRLKFYTVEGKEAEFNGGAPSVLISYGEQNAEAIADAMHNSAIKGKHINLKQPIIVVGVSSSWLQVVKLAVNQVGEMDMQPIYELIERIAPDKVSQNEHWKEKVRQKVQIIRKTFSNN